MDLAVREVSLGEALKSFFTPPGAAKCLISLGFFRKSGQGEEVRIVFQQFSYIIFFLPYKR